MFKDIIAPVQAWLMSQGRCVGCGKNLSLTNKEKIDSVEDKVTCKKCGRIFIYNKESKKYRRASISSV